MRGSKSELFAAPRAGVSRRRHIGAVWQARLNIAEECDCSAARCQSGAKNPGLSTAVVETRHIGDGAAV
jgi:hypothetical protein